MLKKEIPFSFNQIGGMFGFFFTKEFPNNFDDVSASNDKYFESFFKGCLNQGIYFAPSKYEAGFISTKHTKKILDEVINILKAFQRPELITLALAQMIKVLQQENV